MNNNKIITPMTSYPDRINFVSKVWLSILDNNLNKDLYHCVLVLSEIEFPNKEKDLPQDLLQLLGSNIEIIWVKTNTRSHKKLIPTLQKYPENAILVIDDDQLRTKNWLNNFLENHKKYPNDVLAGMCHYRLVNNKFIRCSLKPDIYKNARPANGRGGTLYPPHTFNDETFFDEKLYMTLSPTSDECWQFYFLQKYNIPIRLIQYESDKHLVIKEAQKTALYRTDNDFGEKYNLIWKNITNFFV